MRRKLTRGKLNANQRPFDKVRLRVYKKFGSPKKIKFDLGRLLENN